MPIKIVARASNAAIAAPFRPIAGTGPTPKISMGSRMTFSTAARIISMLGRRVSPVARMLAMPTMPTTMKGTPI